jgi:hypothetical protein
MKTFIQIVSILLLVISFIGCETEKRNPPKGYLPVTPKATENLEAGYFWMPQDKLSSPYWKTAPYVEVQLSNQSTFKLYSDGFLNMTGTYKGLTSFNRGTDSKVTLKAGYDKEYLYILVEWNDTTTNPSYETWLWQGPQDINKDDSSAGWTSQRNNDNLVLYFDDLANNSKNAWRWSLAYTAPFEMALNLHADENGNFENANPIFRNGDENNSRSGPMYEWNGIRQKVLMGDGSVKVLDPAYYLLDSNKSFYSGNIKQGEIIFNGTADCKFCHGPYGNGEFEGSDGGVLADVFTNKYSRQGLIDFISSSAHEGSGGQYFGKIKNDSVKVENLLAFLRGIAGVPGNILLNPSTTPDIKALTNISLGGIDKKNSRYQVLFKRKLMTNATDDVDFFPGNTYSISIRLSDNDEINYVGATGIELIFNSNEL